MFVAVKWFVVNISQMFHVAEFSGNKEHFKSELTIWVVIKKCFAVAFKKFSCH